VKFLIDTHTLLWWLDSPNLLGKTALGLMSDPGNAFLVSPVLPWELSIKANKHQLPTGDLLTNFHAVMRRNRFTVIGVDPLHAIRSGLLPFHHRDPFDRLLAAQSLEMNIPLISRDAVFDRYGVHRIW
jgi:PIN domain nuclease of toxin-antitoxin system